MRTVHRDIVSALIVSKDGKLLMGLKDPQSGGVYADCWHIPGGGVDDGEPQLAALQREVLEETGIDITPHKTALADNKGTGKTKKRLTTGEQIMCNMRFYVYRVDISQNAADIKVLPGDDLMKLEWVDLTQLGQYKLTPPSLKLFDRLGYTSDARPVPVFTVDLPQYNIATEPDHKAIGKVVDDKLRKHFMGQTVGLRAIGSQEHPGKTLDELAEVIKRDGTDRYDPSRTGDRYDNLENKHIDLFLLKRKITPTATIFWQLSWSFYTFPPQTRGTPVRVDILVVYDLAKLKAVRTTHTHQGSPVVKRDGYVFRDPAHKADAVLGIVKIH